MGISHLRGATTLEIKRFYIKFANFIKKKYCGDSLDANELDYLANYVLSLSEIMCLDLDILNENYDLLGSLLITMIHCFPSINKSHQYLIIKNFLLTLNNVRVSSMKHYRMLLRNTIYQGVQWTCSHEIIEADDAQENTVTCKNYLPLWNGILGNLKQTIVTKPDELYAHICKELIDTLLKLSSKLNLKTNYKDVDLDIEAEQDYDLKIFVNVVDLYSDILPQWDKTVIRQYIVALINYNVKLSVKYPLIIGFYKLLTVWLRTANEIDYFSAKRLESNKKLNETCEILSSFTQDLLFQMKEYSENLQIACLEFIISLPITIIKEHLPNITSQLIVILKLGQGYLSIVEMAVDMLERLNINFSESEIAAYLKLILPHLDPYLRSKSLLDNNFSINTNRKTITTLKKRRIVIESNTQLYNLQRKILHFLGTLSSKLSIGFVEDSSKIEPLLWSKSSHLNVPLLHGGKRINLCLDNHLPCVIQLALKCSNRKTRFAACEFLHAVGTIILDKSN